jgi:hypothetical protein
LWAIRGAGRAGGRAIPAAALRGLRGAVFGSLPEDALLLLYVPVASSGTTLSGCRGPAGTVACGVGARADRAGWPCTIVFTVCIASRCLGQTAGEAVVVLGIAALAGGFACMLRSNQVRSGRRGNQKARMPLAHQAQPDFATASRSRQGRVEPAAAAVCRRLAPPPALDSAGWRGCRPAIEDCAGSPPAFRKPAALGRHPPSP